MAKRRIKTGQVARRLGVASATIRYWAKPDTYGKFLSDSARGTEPGATRVYTDDDIVLLASVAHFRARGLTPPEIQEALENGERIENIPDIPTPDEMAVRDAMALMTVSEHQAILARATDEIRRLTDERDQVRIERDKYLEDRQEAVETYNRRIAALEREIGTIQGKLATIESERRPALFWLAVIVVLVVIVAVVVFVLARGGAG